MNAKRAHQYDDATTAAGLKKSGHAALAIPVNQLESVQRRLRRRFQIKRNGNLLDVVFGAATRNGSKDPARSWCIVFFVRRKVKNMNRRHGTPIPPNIRLRLSEGRNHRWVRVPTDVVQRRQPVRTGSRVTCGSTPATAGIVVRWRQANAAQMFFGIATVGHLVIGANSSSAILKAPNGNNLPLILLATAPRRSCVDLALFEFDFDRAKTCGLISGTEIVQSVRPINELVTDMGMSGLSRSQFADIPFSIDYFSAAPLIQGELKGLRDILTVTTATDKGFRKGSSGSAWSVVSQLACLQVGGSPPSFVDGYGQAFATTLIWINDFLTQGRGLTPNSLKVIRVF